MWRMPEHPRTLVHGKGLLRLGDNKMRRQTCASRLRVICLSFQHEMTILMDPDVRLQLGEAESRIRRRKNPSTSVELENQAEAGE